MICPRCGNEWDASKSPCTRCGLVIRMPSQSGPLGRTASSPPQNSSSQQSNGSPANRQQPASSPGAPNNPPSQPSPSSRGSIVSPNTPQPSSSSSRPLGPTTRPINSRAPGSIPGFEHNLQRRSAPQAPANSGQTTTQGGSRASGADTQALLPGTILRGGRYRLYELQERQDWLSGVYEATWIAQDAQRGASQVMICELVTPESNSVVVQSILRTATMALTSVGRHPHIPTLWDAFSDRGRNFFVFESVQGESLLNRMRRTGRAMAEQEVIECSLQMTEVLELLAQQSPPMVHGLISPEHILVGRSGSQYILTNFSIVLAGSAAQFVAGIDRTRLSAYTAPEFVRGVIDVRSDLYSLMATAYYAVTGSLPTGVSGSIPQAQRLNPKISPQFDNILGKGLRPIASQRYQRSSELRQDLLAMRSVSGTLVPGSGQHLEQPAIHVSHGVQSGQKIDHAPAQQVPDSVAQALKSLASVDDEEDQSLLPRPEQLPPFEEHNDMLQAAFWLGAILVCLVLVIVFSRGFF
ncbi:MAG: hypothetical protein E6I90_04160 [Chloroflexi bacterium]|nr:MAG: hypothetical protein E6I90_04160 [Chloroflexota bacterium]